MTDDEIIKQFEKALTEVKSLMGKLPIEYLKQNGFECTYNDFLNFVDCEKHIDLGAEDGFVVLKTYRNINK